jgi:DNA-binding transcriptional regulator LsrR (DeoR family)
MYNEKLIDYIREEATLTLNNEIFIDRLADELDISERKVCQLLDKAIEDAIISIDDSRKCHRFINELIFNEVVEAFKLILIEGR